MNFDHSASMVTHDAPAGKVTGYNVSLRSGNKELGVITIGNGGKSSLVIQAEMSTPEYRGNTWMPFYKQFTMKYACPFKTLSGPPKCKVEGKIDGSVKLRILGICSRNKACQLALEQATQSITEYLKKSLKD
jgi:hypothetical protein